MMCPMALSILYSYAKDLSTKLEKMWRKSEELWKQTVISTCYGVEGSHSIKSKQGRSKVGKA